jgi:putative transposase
MKPEPFNDANHVHLLTFSCFHRRQFLTDDFARQCLAHAIDFARAGHDVALWAYVFMPEHVHLLIHPRCTEYSIGDILRDIKEQPARQAIRRWRERSPWKLEQMKARQGKREVHRLWPAGGGYDRNLYSQDKINKAIAYIEWNPVRRGMVEEPLQWRWSSARARAGLDDVPLAVDPVNSSLGTIQCS